MREQASLVSSTTRYIISSQFRVGKMQLWAAWLIFFIQFFHVVVMPARITRTEIVKDTSTLYNDDGEILQVSYAENAIAKSSSLVGLTNGRIGFLLTRVPLRSRLLVHNPRITYNSLDVIGGRLMMAFTGLPGDVKCILRRANILCEDHRVKCGETMPLMMIIKELCKYATLSLHPSEDDKEDKIGRPLACKGLLIGLSKERFWYDDDDENVPNKNVNVDNVRSRGEKRMSMMVCEHSGTYYETPIAVIGKMEATKVNRLINMYESNDIPLREVLLNAGNLLFEEQESDGDKYGFLELHIMTTTESERSGGIIELKSPIKSIEELSRILDAYQHLE